MRPLARICNVDQPVQKLRVHRVVSSVRNKSCHHNLSDHTALTNPQLEPDVRAKQYVAETESQVQDMVFAKISKQLSAIEVEKEGWTKQKIKMEQDFQALQNHYRLKKEDQQITEQKLNALSDENNQLHDDLSRLQLCNRKIQKELHECQGTYQHTIAAMTQTHQNAIQSMKSQYEKQVHHVAQQNQKDNQQQVSMLQTNVQQSRNELRHMQHLVTAARESNTKLQKDLMNKVHARQDLEEKHHALDKMYRKTCIDLEHVKCMWEEAIGKQSKVENQLQTTKGQLAQAVIEQEHRGKYISRLETRKTQLTKQLKHSTTKVEKAHLDLTRQEQKINQLQKENQLVQQNLKHVKAALIDTQKRCRYLENVLEKPVAAIAKSKCHHNNNTKEEGSDIPDASRHPDSDAPNWLRY